ncbi:MAG: hypothetical protein U1E28_07960 [Beijerinckiaceae bacterium]
MDLEETRSREAVSIAWLIALNKPFYPLYVWWLAGAEAAWGSVATMASAPLYLAVPFVARRKPFAGRFLLVAVGLADTLFATKLFGAAAGAELFLAPCALLAYVCFSADESRWRRALAACIFAAFGILHGRYGAALNGWSAETGAKLLDLNAWSAAGLSVFIVWRFAPLR